MLVKRRKRGRLLLEYGLLALLVFTAVLLRTTRLGDWDFGGDEILHIYAANEVIRGEPPRLPSGQLYDRSLLYTYSVAAVGSVVGLNEVTARLPGVLFGTLTVVAVFFVARAWYSSLAGLISAFLIAFLPAEVDYSREVRMYALFQLLNLLTLFLVFQALEANRGSPARWIRGRNLRSWSEKLRVDPILLVIASALLVTTVSVHRLTMVAMAGPWVYATGMAVAAVWSDRRREIASLKWIAISVLPVLTILLIRLVSPASIQEMLEIARHAPTWAQGNVDNWAYYLRPLRYDYPVLVATSGVAAISALLQNWRASIFLICCFGVPLLLHSFALAWKADRYIHHLLPLFGILWSAGFAKAISAVYQALAAALNAALGPKRAKLAAGFAVGATAAMVLLTTPWFVRSVKAYVLGGKDTPLQASHPGWKKAMAYVANRAQPNDVIIVSRPLQALYYGPDLPIYHLNNNLENLILGKDLRDSSGRQIEYTAGAPVIMDVEALRNVVIQHPSGWYVTETFRFFYDRPTPPAIRQFVLDHFQPQEVGDELEISVWRWEDLGPEVRDRARGRPPG